MKGYTTEDGRGKRRSPERIPAGYLEAHARLYGRAQAGGKNAKVNQEPDEPKGRANKQAAAIVGVDLSRGRS